MTGSKNTLRNSEIGGNFIGGDDFSDKSINIINSYDGSRYLEDLYNKFQEEIKTNQGLKEFCEELDYFNTQIADESVKGLDNKLIAGNREKILDYAKELKERFHKKLIRTSQFSNIAQDINVYILSKVRRSFMMEIYTLICNNEPEDKINVLITERIINPVKTELGLNLFKYNEEDIMGMIFFLTGNCHIKWTK
jgi:hypothetical protein